MKLSDFNRLRSEDALENLESVIRSFNRTDTEYGRHTTTHARFSAQASTTPHAVAVVDQHGEHTYQELDGASNGLARYLINERLQREEIVAVLLDDTFKLLVSLLAILKAGGAYLPVDHKLPGERVNYLLGDTRARIIISEQSYADRLRENNAVPEGVRLHLLGDALNHTDPIEERSSADGLAYVIYTSGTTGVPKGVMVPHRAILRLVLNTNYVDLSSPQRIIRTGALAFDASTFEIWGALLNGGCLCSPPEHAILDAAELKDLIRRHHATAMFLTTGLFNQLVEMDVDVFSRLDTLLTGGERTSVLHVNKVKTAAPQLSLNNIYGPTENTTFTTFYPITELQDRDVPIGRPLANTQVVILDSKQKLVPIGVAGEICAGGAGLARGYLNDPALTAAKFVPHPFEAGQRLYRTGDWGRWTADGNIEFLGRKDQQVKIRGYRIEPAEIEARLSEYPAVGESAVVAMDLGKETAVLVAYLTGPETLDVEDVRKHLTKSLPEYMIPGIFIKLDKMPLTRNGKFDRTALPDPCEAQQGDKARVPPRTETEKELVSIWQTVLRQEDVSVTDDFFTAGGHSLEVTRLICLIQERLGVAVPLSIIFKPATIRDLAQYILDATKFGVKGIDDAVVLLSRNTDGPRIFAFPPGTGDALGYIQLAELLPSYTFYAFNFLEAETRMADYVDLITGIDPIGPYLLFGYSAGGNLAFHVARELENKGKRVSDIVMLDAWQCRQKVPFPEDEVDRVAASFLGHESVAPYLANKVLKEKAYRLIERYYSYIRNALDLHTVAADIHLVLSGTAAEPFRLDSGEVALSSTGWAEVTSGKFRIWHGEGGHRVMLNHPHLEANAAILRNVFDLVCSSSTAAAGER